MLPPSLLVLPRGDAYAFREHDRRSEASAELSREGKLELTDAARSDKTVAERIPEGFHSGQSGRVVSGDGKRSFWPVPKLFRRLGAAFPELHRSVPGRARQPEAVR